MIERTATESPERHRLQSIDLMRGGVIVLMALDHARDFFSPFPYAPEDLTQASAGLFLTRWITHFCAPIFVILAGVGAGLSEVKIGGKRRLSLFLLTRGIWLIVLELSIVNIAWLSYWNGYGFVQVLWALGWSMILLAGLIHLPRTLQWFFAGAMIAGHNLLDGISASSFEAPFDVLWGLFHQQMWVPMGNAFGFSIVYPLIPWPAIMLFGYLIAPLFTLAEGERRRRLRWLGLALIGGFFVLRLLNLYGDPKPWQVSDRGALFTLLSVLDTTKYPVSLLFVAMTLGPALLMLGSLERVRGRLAGMILVFGRVPLFFYLIHFFVAHGMAILYSQARFGASGWWILRPSRWPPGYEPNLGVTYLAWLCLLLMLFPLCRWFEGVKARRSEWWLRYL